MAKLWGGRFRSEENRGMEDFNSSFPFDYRLYRQDITGSIAHVHMLGKQNIIPKDEADLIAATLSEILSDIESGKLPISAKAEDAEDIHTFVEVELTGRIGDIGKKLHTARSRNDQVALDLRMYLRDEADEIIKLTKKLALTVCSKAEEYKSVIMPGYTHLQRAQPVYFGHHLMAYAMMLLRDVERLNDCKKRINVSPIGCCALAGTTYKTDRVLEAEKLGFSSVCLNSLDGVSDRDFVAEMIGCIALLQMHLSRFSEEVVLWSSWEFKFIELSDSFTTGSSIMPQKKNPDMAELVRGKTGRVYGDLMSILTVLKGLPLAYNKDMQEDKESVFDACDTVKMCLSVFDGMIGSLKAIPENMKKAAQKGFINATDLADYLVKKGLPFRSAYKISGTIVSDCIKSGCVLEEMALSDYKKYSELFENDLFAEINIENCAEKRDSLGGTSVKSVEAQIQYVRDALK